MIQYCIIFLGAPSGHGVSVAERGVTSTHLEDALAQPWYLLLTGQSLENQQRRGLLNDFCDKNVVSEMRYGCFQKLGVGPPKWMVYNGSKPY